MKTINAKSQPALVLVALALSLQAAFAGKPGGGPGGSTGAGMVTIDQDKAVNGGVTDGDAPGFPVTLSQPGSYRLEGNLTVPNTSTSAIVITAKDVTLDLDGFVIAGPNVCAAPGSCIVTGGADGISSAAEHTTVLGGTVRGMGGTGINLGRNARVERMHVQHNGSNGIQLQENSLLTDSTVESNYSYGAWVALGSFVLRNVIGSNSYGVRTSPFPGRVGFGLNFFINNLVAPVDGYLTPVQPNLCYPSGC